MLLPSLRWLIDIDKYHFAVPLCRGSSGFVQLAFDTVQGQQVAIKFMARGPGFNHEAVMRELLNQRACLGHPHIVGIKV